MIDLQLTPGMQREFNALFCDELIAVGSARQVWSSRAMPDCVIKIETGSQSFQNVTEWQLWNDLKHFKPVADWLAPCRWISPSGNILIMERTRPIPYDEYPDRLPKFFSDLKYQNYGKLKGRFVCHDYGLHCVATYGGTAITRRVKWWDGYIQQGPSI